MNLRRAFPVLLMALLLPCRCGFCQIVDWAEFDRTVLRLLPSQFLPLPRQIRSELQRRGCTIPQAGDETKPHNVVRGRFVKPEEWDWAVLCSINRISSILVFRPRSSLVFAELARRPDLEFLQEGDGGRMGYSRNLSAAGRKRMTDHAAFEGAKPPAVDHDGIEDAFAGKASTVLYFQGGKWVVLTGAD